MTEIGDILVTVAELACLWFLMSVPSYLASRTRATRRPGLLGQCIGATLSGAIAYELVILGATVFYGEIIGEGQAWSEVALVSAAALWVLFYHRSLLMGWSRATIIAATVVGIFLGTNLLLGEVLGLSLPAFFQFPISI